MPEIFRCPSCSAPLEYRGTTVQKCEFCGGSVIVPAAVMENSRFFGGRGALDFGDLSRLTGKALRIAEVQRLLHSGNKIQAIKVFRETFGVGLSEAKAAVDKMERGEGIDVSGIAVRAAPPQRFSIGQARAPRSAAVVREVGRSVAGSLISSIIITAFVFGGVIALAFYLITKSTDRAIERPFAAEPAPPAERPLKKGDDAAPSIAAETLRFGGEGTGAGKFRDNRTIAVDSSGKIYSADYTGGRVQVFDSNGAFETQFFADASRTVDALAADRKGNLFVLQGYDAYRLDAKTGEIRGKYRVDSASDLAVGLDGKLYVASRRGAIAALDAEGRRLKTVQLGKDLNLDSIDRIAVDGAGNFFLLDGRNSAVFKLSPEGRLLTRFGGLSRMSDEKASRALFASRPEALAVDSQGRVYASQNTRISVFDANGNFLEDFKTTQAFGMAFNERDELLVAARPFVVKYRLKF